MHCTLNLVKFESVPPDSEFPARILNTAPRDPHAYFSRQKRTLLIFRRQRKHQSPPCEFASSTICTACRLLNIFLYREVNFRGGKKR